MTEYVKAWQCIGCGRIEAPQDCIGVCQYKKVDFVYADEHRAALAHAREVRQSLEAMVRRIALTTPRSGEWERSYRGLQEQARKLLASLEGDAPDR